MNYALESVAFTSLPVELSEPRLSSRECFSALAQIIAIQTEKVVSSLSIEERQSINRHFLCSTMIELPFTSGELDWSEIVELFKKQPKSSEIPLPCSFVNAYECASWGYSARYYKRVEPQAKYLLFSILDANLLNLSFWKENENWGASGFGLTTVLIKTEQSDDHQVNDNSLIASCATTYNSTPEFATIIRRLVLNESEVKLSLPFFPEEIRVVFDKMLQASPRIPDLHHKWGHCFGSDPWLSIIEYGLEHSITKLERMLVCSIALNGYYCLMEVNITPNSKFYLDKVSVLNDFLNQKASIFTRGSNNKYSNAHYKTDACYES
ncbi:MAG: hypothetical protein OQJ89_05110 [Kangiellaceae bacterium]|nr:hypothetical protein [Kangiellaceae bacterium]MCW8999906.1 hypothetical protein [Kangiellaceae bacterium]MCW9016323.1 hypothetical protein [Kangiellaceae bacterium]